MKSNKSTKKWDEGNFKENFPNDRNKFIGLNRDWTYAKLITKNEAPAILEDNKISKIRKIIADDSYAMTFQSLDQYRTALLREIDKL